MENLKAITKELQKIKKEYNLNGLSDDVLFDKAVSIFIHQDIAEEKKEYNKSYSNPNEKATSKQTYFLKKHGYTGDLDKLTKFEASKLIEEFKK